MFKNPFSFLKNLFKNKEFQILLLLIVFILFVGTIFYHYVESWTWIDSFYFSVITLATIGYGDMYPTTELSKLFTVIYLFIGIGTLISFIQIIARHTIEEWKNILINNTKNFNVFSDKNKNDKG